MNAKRMYSGYECAEIKSKKIHGKTYQSHVVQTQRVMQKAFNFYFRSHQAIENIALPDMKHANARKLMSDKKWEIKSDLLDAANNSYIGNDLKWAFEHLAGNQGHWRNESWDGWKGKCNIPIGVANFLYATEARGAQIKTKYREFISMKNTAMELQRRKKWDEIPKKLKYMQKATDDALPLIWVAAGGVTGLKTATDYGKTMGKWIGYGANVHSILSKTIYVSSTSKSWERIAIEEMSKFVLNKLPIFGSLYAGLIDDVPKLMTWFQKYGRRTKRMIEHPNSF